MPTGFIFLFGCVLSFIFSSAYAQQKVHLPVSLWPELQGEYVFKNNSFLTFRNQYRLVLDPDLNRSQEPRLLQHLDRVQFRLGYEHVFSPSWSLGFSETMALERGRNIFIHDVNSRYTVNMGKLRVSQRYALEYVMRRPGNSHARYRLRTDLDYTFALGEKRLRPRASYELFFNNTPAQSSSDLGNQFMDRTRLRLECQVGFNKHFSLTPYFMRQTDYKLARPEFNVDGNIIMKKEKKILPVYGLEFRTVVFAAK